MSELTYTRSGDYLIPDLSLTEQPQAPLGKYGRMRKNYLKEHRPDDTSGKSGRDPMASF